MEVTKQNFQEVLQELDETLEKCDFISIDCEFTGIDNKINRFDLPEDVYIKSIKSLDFIIIQMGITAVTIQNNEKNDHNDSDDDMEQSNNNTDKKFTYRSYNFYICPRSWKIFQCQSNSLQFLAENGFDFNKLFSNGIPYLNQPEEQMLRKKLNDLQTLRQNPNKSNHIPVPDKDKGLIDEANKLIEELLASEENEKTITNNNGFQRKLIYELIEAKYFDKVVASTSTVKNTKVITIKKKKSHEEEEKLEKEKIVLELKNNIGMSAVLQKISESRKIIVGHNIFMDLIYIVKQFFTDLPDTLNEYKKCVSSLFPRVIDTKYMATHEKFEIIQSTILENLIDYLSNDPFSLPEMICETKDNQYSQLTKKYHEAGFDSYITAVVFLSLAKYLGSKFPKNFENDEVLQPFLNKVFLMNVEGLSYIDLIGKEPTPSRDHVFHIICPENWTENDLINQFKEYGSINIKWIDSKNVIITLHNRQNAKEVLKTIKKCPGFEIQSFADYKKSSLELSTTESPISISSSLSSSTSSVSSSPIEYFSPISKEESITQAIKKKREDEAIDSHFVEGARYHNIKKFKN